MADVLGPDAKVYTGIWVDWSKNSPWGLTLTLSPTTAVILTNSLSIFVTVAGVQLWTIVRYLLHRHGTADLVAMPTPHIQKQQFILRNAASALETAHLMLDIAWTSRKSSGKRSRRAFAVGIAAILYSVALMVAGIFSDQMIRAPAPDGKSWTKSINKGCGIYNQTYLDIIMNSLTRNPQEFDMYVEDLATQEDDILSSHQYSQQCYVNKNDSSDSSISSLCQTFRQPKLRWSTVDVPCLFAPTMCQSGTIAMDTGMIDSHKDLGINADPENRVQYRRVTTCTILNGTGRISGWDGHVVNTSSPRPAAESAHIFYGPSYFRDTPWTHSFANFVSFYDNSSKGDPYQVSVLGHYGQDGSHDYSDFEPIPELAQDLGDTTLIFLSYTGTYFEPVDDPWFSAHKASSYNGPYPFLQNRYEKDMAISTAGCVEKHQFCTSSTCTSLSGLSQVQDVAEFNESLTPKQNATFDRLVRAVIRSTLRITTDLLSDTSVRLLASNATAMGRSGAITARGLPDHQWKLELENWQSVSLAQFQRLVGKWASGTVAPQPQYLLKPLLKEDIWFCNNFVVLSSSFKSFSVMALIFTFLFGTLVILIGLFIESIGRGLQKFFTKSPPESHWSYDELLVLQRSDKKREQPPVPPPKDQKYMEILTTTYGIVEHGTETQYLHGIVSPPEYTTLSANCELKAGMSTKQAMVHSVRSRSTNLPWMSSPTGAGSRHRCASSSSCPHTSIINPYRTPESISRSLRSVSKSEKTAEEAAWV